MSRVLRDNDSSVRLGEVTLCGSENGVLTEAEQRGLPMCAPGGYVWRPRSGQQVILLKTGDGTPLIAGALSEDSSDDLLAGEMQLVIPGSCSLTLKNDGRVLISGNLEITGDLTVTGTLNAPGIAE